MPRLALHLVPLLLVLVHLPAAEDPGGLSLVATVDFYGGLISPELADFEVRSDPQLRLAAAFIPAVGLMVEEPRTYETGLYNLIIGPGVYLDPTIDVEESRSGGSSVTGARVGLLAGDEHVRGELTVGVGLLSNNVFVAGLVRADATCRIRIHDRVEVGPHVGLLRLSRGWVLDDEEFPVEIGGTTVGLVGASCHFRIWRWFHGNLSVDWWFDRGMRVEPELGWVVPGDELHLNGVLGQLGISFIY